MDKAVVFDLYGPMAVYRKFFTNTSILSYSFPPPTAVRGLVGAFLGMNRKEYVEKLENMLIAVSMLNPVKKLHTTINYMNTKQGENALGKGRTQVPTEIIKEPYYRIYLRNMPPDCEEQLVYLLSNHWAEYTPYLGMSEMIANFQFVGEYPVEDYSSDKPVFINSIVPAKAVEPSLLGQNGNRLGKERIPFYMNANKQTLLYMDVAFDMNAKPIPVKGCTYSVVNGTNIKFLTKEDTVTFQRLTVA